MSNKKVDDFFSFTNTVNEITEKEYLQFSNYMSVIESFAMATYHSIYIINYQSKTFEYVSENPLFLCGYTVEQVKQMGYSFYLENVPKKDIDLLLTINRVGFEFYDTIDICQRKHYTISYDFHLKHKNGNIFLVNHKLTPLFLNEKGKIWKAMCVVSLSANQEAGNIKFYKKGESLFWEYNIEKDFWSKEEQLKLTNREKEIIHLSAQGFTVSKIAEKISISTDTVKFHRRNLFEKLGVFNITEAILYAVNNKLL